MDVEVSDAPAVPAAAWIARRLRAAIRLRGSASLAVSGGSTAPALLAALVRHDLDWSAVSVWQVDERVAPDGDAGRNANQLEGMPCRVVPMPVTARDLRAAARRYAASLPDRFDIVHLGLGDDGHTASWPPGRPEVIVSDRPVELVPEFNGFERMTVTGTVVNGARARVVFTVGASKRPMVERWLLGDRTLPITAVRRAGTVLFVDPAAAPSGPLHPARDAG